MLPILFFVLLSFSPNLFYCRTVSASLLLVDGHSGTLIDLLTKSFVSGALSNQRISVKGLSIYSSEMTIYYRRYFLMNHSLFAVNLLTGAAEGTGISATGGVRGSGCFIFDKSSFNSILIMSSWKFSAS